jgi:cell division protease FtsH
MDDIYDSIDRIQIGLEKKGSNFSKERMKLVAYHEAGHALLGALMKEYDLVNTISIVPRGSAGGITVFTPNEEAMESGMYTKEYLENRICVALGGRIAEEIINGKNKVTTGA